MFLDMDSNPNPRTKIYSALPGMPVAYWLVVLPPLPAGTWPCWSDPASAAPARCSQHPPAPPLPSARPYRVLETRGSSGDTKGTELIFLTTLYRHKT